MFFFFSLSTPTNCIPTLSSFSLTLLSRCHSVFYKPHIQSLGYHPVTVATSLTSHHFGAHSHAVTWPLVFHRIGRWALATSVDTLLVGRRGPNKVSLLIFIPFFLHLQPFFRTPQSLPPRFSATLLWQTARDCITSAFSFDTSSLIECMSGKHKICLWIQAKAHKFSRFRLETLAPIPKRTVVMFSCVYEHVFSTFMRYTGVSRTLFEELHGFF